MYKERYKKFNGNLLREGSFSQSARGRRTGGKNAGKVVLREEGLPVEAFVVAKAGVLFEKNERTTYDADKRP